MKFGRAGIIAVATRKKKIYNDLENNGSNSKNICLCKFFH